MRVCFLFFLLVQVVAAAGQSAITKEDRAKANAFFTARDWVNASKSYKTIFDQEPQNATASMRLGQSLSGMGKYTEAISILEQSVKLGQNPQAMYSLAGVYSMTNNPDKTFEWMDKAIAGGFNQRTMFLADENFNGFKKDGRYKSIVEKIDRAISPCHFASEWRQFDFWIGEWDVKNQAGATAGKSSIQLLLGECVIYENWTSAPPQEYSGKSFNFFNSITKKWQQTWVDDKGGLLEFIDGSYQDDKMVFVTHPNAQNLVTRLTFHNIDKDTVRQVFENTSDNGKTWTTTTDLIYHRIK